MDRLAELDCDPIEGMVTIANDPTSSQEYRKAVDMTASVDGNISIDIVKFSDIEEDEAQGSS